MVFDNLRPNGISYIDWINDLGGKIYTNPPMLLYFGLNFKTMNYNELMESIEKRPGFFLRNKNLEELDAFLRGVSYMNFVKEKADKFRDFCDNWFPNIFPEYTHDWLVTLREMSNTENEWDLFFEFWKRYIHESEQKNN